MSHHGEVDPNFDVHSRDYQRRVPVFDPESSHSTSTAAASASATAAALHSAHAQGGASHSGPSHSHPPTFSRPASNAAVKTGPLNFATVPKEPKSGGGFLSFVKSSTAALSSMIGNIKQGGGSSSKSSFQMTKSGLFYPVFGQDLKKIAAFMQQQHLEDRRYPGVMLPRQILQISEYIVENGGKFEGIFRISGDSVEIATLKKRLDAGEDIDIVGIGKQNIHNLTGLYKSFWRSLGEPLFPFEFYDRFLQAHDQKNSRLISQIAHEQLPQPNTTILQYLLTCLARIEADHKVNKMTANNLAIVFAPNIIRPKVETMQSAITDTAKQIAVVATLIEEYVEKRKQQPATAQAQAASAPAPSRVVVTPPAAAHSASPAAAAASAMARTSVNVAPPQQNPAAGAALAAAGTAPARPPRTGSLVSRLSVAAQKGGAPGPQDSLAPPPDLPQRKKKRGSKKSMGGSIGSSHQIATALPLLVSSVNEDDEEARLRGSSVPPPPPPIDETFEEDTDDEYESEDGEPSDDDAPPPPPPPPIDGELPLESDSDDETMGGLPVAPGPPPAEPAPQEPLSPRSAPPLPTSKPSFQNLRGPTSPITSAPAPIAESVAQSSDVFAAASAAPSMNPSSTPGSPLRSTNSSPVQPEADVVAPLAELTEAEKRSALQEQFVQIQVEFQQLILLHQQEMLTLKHEQIRAQKVLFEENRNSADMESLLAKQEILRKSQSTEEEALNQRHSKEQMALLEAQERIRKELSALSGASSGHSVIPVPELPLAHRLTVGAAASSGHVEAPEQLVPQKKGDGSSESVISDGAGTYVRTNVGEGEKYVLVAQRPVPNALAIAAASQAAMAATVRLQRSAPHIAPDFFAAPSEEQQQQQQQAPPLIKQSSAPTPGGSQPAPPPKARPMDLSPPMSGQPIAPPPVIKPTHRVINSISLSPAAAASAAAAAAAPQVIKPNVAPTAMDSPPFQPAPTMPLVTFKPIIPRASTNPGPSVESLIPEAKTEYFPPSNTLAPAAPQKPSVLPFSPGVVEQSPLVSPVQSPVFGSSGAVPAFPMGVAPPKKPISIPSPTGGSPPMSPRGNGPSSGAAPKVAKPGGFVSYTDFGAARPGIKSPTLPRGFAPSAAPPPPPGQ